MNLLDWIKLLKEIGLSRVAGVVSFIAWFLLPFLIWNLIRLWIGKSYFSISWAIPGILVILIGLGLQLTQTYFAMTYEFRLMRSVAYAKSIFKDPTNPDNERNYIAECWRFIIPCIYQLPVVASGLPRFASIGIWGTVLSAYNSYSIFTVVTMYQNQLVQAIGLVPMVGLWMREALAILVRYPLHSVVAAWLLSLYYEPLIRVRHLMGKMTPVLYVLSLIICDYRVSGLAYLLVVRPALIPKLKAHLHYSPFVDPQTLPNIIQRAVQNIDGTSCNVSRWSQDIIDAKFAEELKRLFMRDPKLPIMLKLVGIWATPEDLVRNIERFKPFLYLGTIDDRCLFLGLIWYNPYDRIRQANFYFDNTYIKDEFMLITRGEIEKRRQLESVLPPSLHEIARLVEAGNFAE